ncbi:MAG: tetratricopeptide repeat protein [Planctomycetota bacterium]
MKITTSARVRAGLSLSIAAAAVLLSPVLCSIVQASPRAEDPKALTAQAREAVKAGDHTKAREYCIAAVEQAPESLAIRLEIAQIAELRKDAWLAREHYGEIVNSAERAAKLKEKLIDEDAKAARDAGAKVKSMQDGYAQSLGKSLKTYSDSILKVARFAKTQKHWRYAGDLARLIKDMFDHTPGVLDPKDPRQVESGKIYNESVQKRGEDKPESDKLRADVSDAVAALAKDLTKLAEHSAAVYEEVRGPFARRRAILPLGILVSLSNDPGGNAKKLEALWARAAEIEPSVSVKLRLANDASRFTLTLNGKEIANAKTRTDVSGFGYYREIEVQLFRELNYIGFYGHEITGGSKKKQGDSRWMSRVWVLIDIPLNDKDRITTDATWTSLTKPPVGWDLTPLGAFIEFPISSIGGADFWDYEKTKTWKGETLAGDPADCWIRKAFDLPGGIALKAPEKAAPVPAESDAK